MADKYANLSDDELLAMANQPQQKPRVAWQTQSYGSGGYGMNPEFMAQVNQLADVFYQTYGRPLTITSGYRPRWREEQIWRSGVRPSVPPGRTSRHTGWGYGAEAVDIASQDIRDVQRLPLSQLGLETLARINDPGHIQSAYGPGHFSRATKQANVRGASPMAQQKSYADMSDEELLALANQGSGPPPAPKGIPAKKEKPWLTDPSQIYRHAPKQYGKFTVEDPYPGLGRDRVEDLAQSIRLAGQDRTSPAAILPGFMARPAAQIIDYVQESPRLQKALGAVGSIIDFPHQAVSKPAGELLSKVLPEEMMMSTLGESGEVGGPEKFQAKRFAKEAVPLMLDLPVYAGAGNVVKQGSALVKGGAQNLRRMSSPTITPNLAPGYFARQAPYLRETAPLPTATLAEPATTAGAEAATVAKGDALTEALSDLKKNLGGAAEVATETPAAAGPAQTVGTAGGWRPWSPPSELDIAAQKMQEQMGIIGRRGFPPQFRGPSPEVSAAEYAEKAAGGYGFSPPAAVQPVPAFPAGTRRKFADEAAVEAEWRARQAGGYGAGPIGKGMMGKVVFPPTGAPRPPIDFKKLKKIEQTIGINLRGIDPRVNQNLRLIDALTKYGGEPTIESVIHQDPATILWNEMLKRGGG